MEGGENINEESEAEALANSDLLGVSGVAVLKREGIAWDVNVETSLPVQLEASDFLTFLLGEEFSLFAIEGMLSKLLVLSPPYPLSCRVPEWALVDTGHSEWKFPWSSTFSFSFFIISVMSSTSFVGVCGYINYTNKGNLCLNYINFILQFYWVVPGANIRQQGLF